MNKNRITLANRKFFLKWLPFNFCDRHCERCFEIRDDCKIYQEEVQFKLQCVMKGKNPDDSSVAFEHVAHVMAQTAAMLEGSLKERGVEINEEDIGDFDEYWKRKEKVARAHPLYKQSQRISKSVHDFLLSFQVYASGVSVIVNTIQKEIGEISFYGNLIHIKAVRVLHSQIEEEDERYKFSRPDSLVSATISYYSMLSVEKSLKNIKALMDKRETVCVLKINYLLNEIEKGKKILEKNFPHAEKFRNKIIFHGNY